MNANSHFRAHADVSDFYAIAPVFSFLRFTRLRARIPPMRGTPHMSEHTVAATHDAQVHEFRFNLRGFLRRINERGTAYVTARRDGNR